MQVSIVAGVREKEGRLFRALQKLDVRVERRPLPVADYLAGAVLVERKSVRDLHLAIIQGRFWPQGGGLSRTQPHPGISTVTAQALLRRFGSVAAVLDAGPEEWLSIHGVCPKRMQALRETLGRSERHD